MIKAVFGLLLAAVLLEGSLFSVAGVAARLLTLQEAVRLAVELDPDTGYARQSIAIAELRKSQASWRYLPKLDFGLVNSPQIDYYGQPVIDKMLWNSFISIELPLYAGGTIRNSVQMAEAERRRQAFDYLISRQKVTTEVIRAYFQALSFQAAVDQYAELYQQGSEEVAAAELRMQAGLVSRLDVLEAKVRLLDIQQRLAKAKGEHQVARASLCKILGLEESDHLRLVDELPFQDIPGEYDRLLAEAQQRRPELRYLDEHIKYSQLRTTVEKGKQKPHLSLVMAHEWQAPDLFDREKSFVLYLKATYSWENTTLSYQESRQQIYPNVYAFPRFPGAPPLRTYYFPARILKCSLFDNSANKVELAQAQADLELAKDRRRQEQQGLYSELKGVLTQKQESASRMQLAKKQLALAEEIVNIQRSKYRAGLTTLAEVLKARTAVAEARLNFMAAKKDYAVALAQLYRLVGRDPLPEE